MPRGARQLNSTGIYHIMLRGTNQQQILEDKEDNGKFFLHLFRLTDEQAKEIIMKISKCKSAPEFQLLETKTRNSCIKRLRKDFR